MRHQGRITTWHDEKGYGAITRNGGGTPLFVHVKGFRRGQRRPVGGELVTYEEAADERGRGRAINVSFVGTKAQHARRTSSAGRPSLAIGVGFLIAIAAMAFMHRLPWIVVGWYCLASVITFMAYANDKNAAQRGRWRTPENTLQLLALIGGWPGAAIAQALLRHKSQKLSFRVVFWTLAAIHCTAAGWLFFSDEGRTFFSRLISGA